MKNIPVAPESTDLELLALARTGDQAAYGRLVSRHQTLIASLAYGICGDFSRSQDIAQEAFVAAWRQLVTLKDAAKFKPWFCGIVRNLAHNAVRQEARRDPRAIAASELPAEAPNPDEHAIAREESALVWHALEQLPEIYREPLILFYREHHAVERVAAALDLTEAAVRQRLARGRALLRTDLEKIVERSLGRTVPGRAFTNAVMGALPFVMPANSGDAIAAGTPLAPLSWSFLGHTLVALAGYFSAAKLKVSPGIALAAAALGWGLIAVAVVVVWLVSPS